MQIVQVAELDKKRYQIRLDGGQRFVLYKGEARELELKEGAQISQEAYQKIRIEILGKRACKRAMFLLEKTDRTEAQLREKLRQGLYDEELVEQAIAYVKGYHYLDDDRYAHNFVRFQKERKSRRRMEQELMQKGVDRAIIAQVMEEEYQEENEQELILKWAEKKHYSRETADAKEKQKMYQFLLRKGFHSNDILHVLDYLT